MNRKLQAVAFVRRVVAPVSIAVVLCAALASNSNAKAAAMAPTTNELLALDKQATEAYLRGDGRFFEGLLSEKFVMTEHGRRMSKAVVIKMISGVRCDIKDWSLSEPHMERINDESYVLSYKATMNGTCTSDGKTYQPPSPVRAATVWMRNAGKWHAVFHGENPIVDPKTLSETSTKEESEKGDLTRETAAATGTTKRIDASDGVGLVAAENAVWRAWKEKDASKLEKLTAADLTFVNIFGTYFSNKADDQGLDGINVPCQKLCTDRRRRNSRFTNGRNRDGNGLGGRRMRGAETTAGIRRQRLREGGRRMEVCVRLQLDPLVSGFGASHPGRLASNLGKPSAGYDSRMQIEHLGLQPRIHESARIAPNAVICGDVTIGKNCSVGFGAVLTAESGPIAIGEHCVVMDTAVLRGVRSNPLKIGNRVLIGPRAYLSGCEVEDDVFLATGATVFNGAVIGSGSEVRINGVVHLRTVLPPNTTVPIGWVAVGNPADVLPPNEHERIWSVQKPLDFPRYVFGVSRPAENESILPSVMPRYSAALRRHTQDRILEAR